MKKHIPALSALCASVFLFLSCLDIDAKVSLAQDGSGTLDMTYRVSQLAMNLGNVEQGQTPLPLPVSEQDFRRTVQAVKGLSLKAYKRTDDAEKSVIAATLEFTDVKVLGRFLGEGEDSFSLKNEGGSVSFQQLLVPGNPEPLDDKTREFFQTFFKNYGLSFTVEAPGAIKKSSLKDAEIKGREAKLRIPFIAAAEAKEPIVWKIEW